MKDDYNGHFCLDNLFDRQWNSSAARYESTHLELDPCVCEALPPMPTQQRVEPVTVCYPDGSEAPVTYGIPIDWYATYQQLSDGVGKQCGLAEDKQIVLVLLEFNLFSRLWPPIP